MSNLSNFKYLALFCQAVFISISILGCKEFADANSGFEHFKNRDGSIDAVRGEFNGGISAAVLTYPVILSENNKFSILPGSNIANDISAIFLDLDAGIRSIGPSVFVDSVKPLSENEWAQTYLYLPWSQMSLNLALVDQMALIHLITDENGEHEIGVIPVYDLLTDQNKIVVPMKGRGIYQVVLLNQIIVDQHFQKIQQEPLTLTSSEALGKIDMGAPTISFDLPKWQMTLRSHIEDNRLMSECVMRLDGDQSAPWDYSASFGNNTETKLSLRNMEGGRVLYGSYICLSEDGRIDESPWTDAIPLPSPIEDEFAPIIKIDDVADGDLISDNRITLSGECEDDLVIDITLYGLSGPTQAQCTSGIFEVAFTSSSPGKKTVALSQVDSNSNRGYESRSFYMQSSSISLSIGGKTEKLRTENDLILWSKGSSGFALLDNNEQGKIDQLIQINDHYVTDMTIQNQWLWLADPKEGFVLRYDISNPQKPEFIDQRSMPGAQTLARKDGRLAVAGQVIQIWDLPQSPNAAVMLRSEIDMIAEHILLTDQLLIASNSANKIYFWDISDPIQPVLSGEYQAQSEIKDLQVDIESNRLWILENQGLQLIDAAEPSAIVVRTRDENISCDGDIEITLSDIWVSCGSVGLLRYSHPGDDLLGTPEVVSYQEPIENMVIMDEMAWIVTETQDLLLHSTASPLGTISDSFDGLVAVESMERVGDLIIAASAKGLSVWDVAADTPLQLSLVSGNKQYSWHHLTVIGNYIYCYRRDVQEGNDAFQIWKISDDKELVLVRNFSLTGSFHSLSYWNKQIWMGGNGAFMHLDVMDPENPGVIRIIGNTMNYTKTLVKDGFAILADINGLVLLDVNDIEDIEELAILPLAGGINDLAVRGNSILVSVMNRGLFWYQRKTKDGETSLVALDEKIDLSPTLLHLNDQYVYVGEESKGLLCFDMSSPAQVSSCGSVDINHGHAHSIISDSKGFWISHSEGGLIRMTGLLGNSNF